MLILEWPVLHHWVKFSDEVAAPPLPCALNSLLFSCFETSWKCLWFCYTSVSKGAELHKETKDKVLVLSKLGRFPVVNFPHMRSVNWKQDVAQREIKMWSLTLLQSHSSSAQHCRALCYYLRGMSILYPNIKGKSAGGNIFIYLISPFKNDPGSWDF